MPAIIVKFVQRLRHGSGGLLGRCIFHADYSDTLQLQLPVIFFLAAGTISTLPASLVDDPE
jgi:hypothetical protein